MTTTPSTDAKPSRRRVFQRLVLRAHPRRDQRVHNRGAESG